MDKGNFIEIAIGGFLLILDTHGYFGEMAFPEH
jgi:hypothetical protein